MKIKREITPDYVPKDGDVVYLKPTRLVIPAGAYPSLRFENGEITEPFTFNALNSSATHYEREEEDDRRFAVGAVWEFGTRIRTRHAISNANHYGDVYINGDWMTRGQLEQIATYIGHIDDLGKK